MPLQVTSYTEPNTQQPYTNVYVSIQNFNSMNFDWSTKKVATAFTAAVYGSKAQRDAGAAAIGRVSFQLPINMADTAASMFGQIDGFMASAQGPFPGAAIVA